MRLGDQWKESRRGSRDCTMQF